MSARSQKFIWIVSYGSSGPDLDASKFKEYTASDLQVDECCTTTNCALKFTLVHLKRRCRETAMQGFMDFVSIKYGIIPSEIFGYSIVHGNNSSNELYTLPGFQILVQHMKEANPSFSFWIESPDLRRGGILKKYIRQHPIETPNTSDEFDVVKKRRAMDSPSPTPLWSSNDSHTALAMFEDFEHNVLAALELVQEDENLNRQLEVLELESDMSQGKISTTGGVYFAWSSCLNCTKIGATRRGDPTTRLRELSRHVTVPFTLTGWIPTLMPFRLEAVAHLHFAAERIKHAGAGTEFFRIGAEEVEAYCGGVVG